MSALEALEQGEFDRLPGDFYTRAFLKTYAREVQLPDDELLRAYEASRQPAEPPVLAPPAATWSETPTAAAEPSAGGPFRPVVVRWPRHYNGPLGIGLAVLLLVTLVLLRGPDKAQAPVAAATGTMGVDKATPAPAATSGRTTLPEKLVIEIRPTAPIWVAATADGVSAIYRLLKPGEQVNVEAAKELSFRIGNAGAFVYAINGVPGKALGGPDEVREFDITRENVHTFRR